MLGISSRIFQSRTKTENHNPVAAGFMQKELTDSFPDKQGLLARTQAFFLSRSGGFWKLCCLSYFAQVMVRLCMGIWTPQPWLFADEMGYLGIARYLSGTAPMPDMGLTAFYHPGYSLFLLPAFWIFSDPFHTYKAVIVINSLLMSTLYFSVLWLLDKLFSGPRSVKATVSFVICLYPAFCLYPGLAVAENAFIPCYALLLVTFAKMTCDEGYSHAFGFGLLAGFVYTIHPRALPVTAFSLVLLVVLGAMRSLSCKKVALALVALTLVFTITVSLNKHLKAVGWRSKTPGKEEVISAVSTVSRKISSPPFMKYGALAAAGQLLYLSQATCGLFLAGLLQSGLAVCRRSRSTERRLSAPALRRVMFFTLLSSICIFTASVIQMSGPYDNLGRGDRLIYGRYNEGFLAIYLALGLMGVNKMSSEKRSLLTSTLIIIASLLGLTATLFVGYGNLLARFTWVNGINISGTWPFFVILERLDATLIFVTSFTIAFIAFIVFMFKRQFFLGIIIIGIFFTSISLTNSAALLFGNRTNIEDEKLALLYMKKIKRLGFDQSYGGGRDFFSYQYLLPETSFAVFSSESGQRPEADAFISGISMEKAAAMGARFAVMVPDVERDKALWLLPGAKKTMDLPDARSYLNRPLGTELMPGVWESGFVDKAWWDFDKRVARWTGARALLSIPLDKNHLPDRLRARLISKFPQGNNLRILINGRELFEGQIQQGEWRKTFDIAGMLTGDKLELEILSSVFQPNGLIDSLLRAPRKIGVGIEEIALVAGDK